MGPDDIKRLRVQALAMAPSILPELIGGRPHGREWHAERKANGGLGDSWKFNLDTGLWSAFGEGLSGHDLIGLWAAVRHLNQGVAADEIAARIGFGSDTPVLERTRLPSPREAPQESIPADAPDIPPSPGLGPPTAVYAYGDAFRVLRFDTPDGNKTFRQFTWRRGKWHAKGPGDERPPFRVEELRKHRDAAVLIVEGEKTCLAAAGAMKSHVVLTYAGGVGAWSKTHWECLKDRDVLLWPDADEPGRKAFAQLAEKLAPIAARVRIVNPDGQPEGWDLADAIAEGWDFLRIADYAKAHVRAILVEPTPTAEPLNAAEPSHEGSGASTAGPVSEYIPNAERDDDYPAGVPPRSAVVVWQELRLDGPGDGKAPYATLSNVSQIIQLADAFRGQIWFDTFRERIYHSLRGAAQAWTDIDSMRVLTYIQQTLLLPKVTLSTVHDAVAHAAHSNPRNSVQDWLKSLKWDGTNRLETWVGDCLGVELTEYAMAVSRNWPISMVARAFQPGCQVDTMPVLEGKQGKGKSSVLAILGGDWYSSCGLAFGDKEFLQTIQGKWLIEIPDMAGFGKREHSQIIACITTRSDYYRTSYGRFPEDHPRKCVFSATSEKDDYLTDARGFRRYWPLRCGDIDLNALREQRAQIFAEAHQSFMAGASYHEMPSAQTVAEQSARHSADVWTDDVLNYVMRAGRGEAMFARDILVHGLEVKVDKLDHSAKTRVGNILRDNGWIPTVRDGRRGWVKY